MKSYYENSEILISFGKVTRINKTYQNVYFGENDKGWHFELKRSFDKFLKDYIKWLGR